MRTFKPLFALAAKVTGGAFEEVAATSFREIATEYEPGTGCGPGTCPGGWRHRRGLPGHQVPSFLPWGRSSGGKPRQRRLLPSPGSWDVPVGRQGETSLAKSCGERGAHQTDPELVTVQPRPRDLLQEEGRGLAQADKRHPKTTRKSGSLARPELRKK